MEGKTILVTGATSEIGFYTARNLASKGARVIITGRDGQRGRQAVRSLRHQVGDDRIEFLPADHSTVGGNQKLAEQISRHVDRLDGLVNNVGGFHNDRIETEDGYEATLAMNFIGPFALTEALLPVLVQSAPARVVNVASAAHAMWKRDPLEDIQSEESYLGPPSLCEIQAAQLTVDVRARPPSGEQRCRSQRDQPRYGVDFRDTGDRTARDASRATVSLACFPQDPKKRFRGEGRQLPGLPYELIGGGRRHGHVLREQHEAQTTIHPRA